MGVVIVHIHRALGIKVADDNGSSGALIRNIFAPIEKFTRNVDPYVTVCYARQGKPLFSTRIIQADLNPCFEESTAVTVDANAIKIGEQLRLQLWDSDRASADDMLGFVDVDLLGKHFSSSFAVGLKPLRNQSFYGHRTPHDDSVHISQAPTPANAPAPSNSPSASSRSSRPTRSSRRMARTRASLRT